MCCIVAASTLFSRKRLAFGIAIPFTSFGAYIGLMPLPLSYFPWLIAILLSYCVLTQGIKQWYIRRFGKWL